MTPQLIPYRALLRHENGDPRPPDFGKMASWDNLTLSMKMDPVREARRASLCLIAGVERPDVSCNGCENSPGFRLHTGLAFSTKKPRILPFSPSITSFAHTTQRSAAGALEIHVLLPFKVHPSEVLVAVVSIEEGSEP
jgi:hypothetical protein